VSGVLQIEGRVELLIFTRNEDAHFPYGASAGIRDLVFATFDLEISPSR
jgi:hypothetical protein